MRFTLSSYLQSKDSLPAISAITDRLTIQLTNVTPLRSTGPELLTWLGNKESQILMDQLPNGHSITLSTAGFLEILTGTAIHGLEQLFTKINTVSYNKQILLHPSLPSKLIEVASPQPATKLLGFQHCSLISQVALEFSPKTITALMQSKDLLAQYLSNPSTQRFEFTVYERFTKSHPHKMMLSMQETALAGLLSRAASSAYYKDYLPFIVHVMEKYCPSKEVITVAYSLGRSHTLSSFPQELLPVELLCDLARPLEVSYHQVLGEINLIHKNYERNISKFERSAHKK